MVKINNRDSSLSGEKITAINYRDNKLGGSLLARFVNPFYPFFPFTPSTDPVFPYSLTLQP